MANTSFGSLLKNPLVLGVLATDMTSNLAKSYMDAQNQERATEAAQTEKLKTMAASTGQIQTEVPREGLFGKIGAGIGLLSPTTPAKPYQIAEEGLAIQGQQQAMQSDTEKLVDLRTKLGPQNFKKLMDQYRESGNAYQKKLAAQVPDLSTYTPAEIKAMRDGGIAKTIYNVGGTGGTREVTIPKGTIFDPEKEFGKGATLKVPPKPDKTPEEIRRDAKARTLGIGEGKIESSIFTSPNPYYDPVTMNAVTTDMPVEEAKKKGYIPFNANGQMAAASLHASDHEITKIEGIARKWLLPTSKDMDAGTWASAAIAQWVKVQYAAARGNAEAIQLINASKLEGIKVLHDVQKRYPSQIELKSIEAMLPNGSKMAADDFIDNMENLRDYLHAGVGMGVREEAGKIEADSAKTDYEAVTGGD